jgi:hypothetical protein
MVIFACSYKTSSLEWSSSLIQAYLSGICVRQAEVVTLKMMLFCLSPYDVVVIVNPHDENLHDSETLQPIVGEPRYDLYHGEVTPQPGTSIFCHHK